MIGKAIAHYQIEGLLGTGGMGEVYLARDTRLGRNVAVKVVPEVFAQDQERVARFEREAKLLASLNHANIAALYGMEQSEGRHFLVMELVEGETLAERIQRGPIAVGDALAIAHQITEAFEAAHEKGVIHRDLKPANVKITPEGKVKVLDFGLAKALEDTPSQLTSNSPTLLSAVATNAGMILGTAGYMSPEQARGHNVDQRSDVFSFGCVLYEMLTGRQTFPGETVTDIIASVVAREPDFRALPSGLNPKAHDLIRRCLAKNRKDRWHAIADLRVELEAIIADPHGVKLHAAHGSPRGPVWKLALVFALAALLLAVISGIVVWNLRPLPSTAVSRFSFTLPEGVRFGGTGTPILAISPDGANFVYTANQQLYLRKMADLEAHPVQGTAKTPSSPFFSPDGNWIGFYSRADHKFEKIAITGGAAVQICEADNGPWTATWGPNDEIFVAGLGLGILRVSANGGKLEAVIPAKQGEIMSSPQVLPGGDAVMFSVAPSGRGADRWNNAQVVVQSLKSGDRKVVVEGGGDARYVSTGHLVYALGSTLYAVRFDLKKLERIGGPVPVLEGVKRATDATTATGQFSISNNGSIVSIAGGPIAAGEPRILALVDRAGARKPLNIPPANYSQPRISPDGKQLALYTDDGKVSDVSIYDFTGETPIRRLTFGGHNIKPVWTRDGERIVFTSDREGNDSLFWQRADGNGTAELLAKGEPGSSPQSESWSADGKTLLVNIRVGGRSGGLATLTLGTDQKLKPFINQGGNASISYDGRWVAYAFNGGSTQNVYVEPFPPTGTKLQITTAGGNNPVWTRDGKQLLYMTLDGRQLMAVDILQTQPSFRFGKTTALPIEGIVSVGPRPYDIMPDGKSFVVMFSPSDLNARKDAPDQINITLNWFEELNKLVPVR